MKTTNNNPPQPADVAGVPDNTAWRVWFDTLGSRATSDIVNATATLVIAERQTACAVQPATTPGDDDTIIPEDDLATLEYQLGEYLKDYDPDIGEPAVCPVCDGAVDDHRAVCFIPQIPLLIRIARRAAPPDVTERARRAIERVAGVPFDCPSINAELITAVKERGAVGVAAIIAAEFGRGEANQA